ncbi:MAG: 3-phosphoshikimate 1-carboxyvinyltransferase, partial [Arenicellales bacterium]
APNDEIDLGNSGTAMRLMMGLLAGQNFNVRLTGDASLCSRPMVRIADPLALMGADVEMTDGNAPLEMRNDQRKNKLKAIEYRLPMASAQVKSAVLLAGLYADGETQVIEPAPTRDHTERMLRGFGYEVKTDANHISLKGGGSLTACDIDVPADISSAAFFMVGAVISGGSDITLQHVGVNPTRTGVIQILAKMGARISLQNERIVGGEPVADIRIQSSELVGIDIPEALVPLAIDEIPVIAIAAACAQGITRLSGAEELRVKESDRIMAVVNTLTALGVDAQETPDGFIIQGKGQKTSEQGEQNIGPIFTGGVVQSHDDHRIAMAASIASLRAEGEIKIMEADNVATSFPDYIALANRLGLNLRVEASS